MLIEDFLSVENFHFLFNYFQNYGREKWNYEFILNDQNKKIVGKLMEIIYENNFNTIDKQTANTLVITEIEQIIKKRAKKQFEDVEQIDTFDKIKDIKPIIDFNKIPLHLPKHFQSIFKKQAKGINADLIVEQSYEPQLMFKDVLRKIEFKEHDLTKAPYNINQDLIIPLPDKFKNMFNKPLYIEHVTTLLDSRDRNHNLYPNTNNYSIKLDRTIRNVISVELLQATLPNSEYLINDSNNTIHFQEIIGTTLTAQIPIGNYTIESIIATQLQNAMNHPSNGASSTYNVTFDTLIQRFTISSDRTGGSGIFILKFSEISSSIASVIGFSNIDLSNSGTYTTQNTPNLIPDRSIYMNISANTKDSFDNIEGIQKNFDKFIQLSLTSDFGQYTFWINPKPSSLLDSNIDKDNNYKLIFNPPISIEKLNIEFKKYNEDLLNFFGMEHSLLFRFELFNFHYENILLDYKFPQGTHPLENIPVGGKLESIIESDEELEIEFI